MSLLLSYVKLKTVNLIRAYGVPALPNVRVLSNGAVSGARLVANNAIIANRRAIYKNKENDTTFRTYVG